MTISNNKLIEEETIVLLLKWQCMVTKLKSENTELYDEKFCAGDKDDFIHYGRSYQMFKMNK